MENPPPSSGPASASTPAGAATTNPIAGQMKNTTNTSATAVADNGDHLVHPPAPAKRPGKATIVLCVLAGLILTVLIAFGIYFWYNFHGRIKPTELSQPEQQLLSEKLEVVTGQPVVIEKGAMEAAGRPSVINPPEDIPIDDELVYAEDRRTLILTEREINGFLHHNTDLAERIRIELGTDTITAKTITTFEEDTPMVGGKTLRVNFTLGALLDPVTGKMIIEIRDVTAGGVPIPNAWLGDIKNKNLIDLGDNQGGSGILRKIADGIANFQVENGQIRIRLNE